ncbi:putative phospholipid ABC transporter permease protein MlaE [mine drainage metagenome]|uniref:Putative phospholipid ABC transporter permease protein MlaE n=1 Tax=mine drainage metagenome TaxID=410659 RepID=A0A1J5S338_9ZZZZ
MIDEKNVHLIIETNASSQPVMVTVRCIGAWVVKNAAQLEPQLDAIALPDIGTILIDGSEISALDTSGAWLLHRTISKINQHKLSLTINGLRPEFNNLLKLISSYPTKQKSLTQPKLRILANIGQRTWRTLLGLLDIFAFIGECAVVLLRSILHPHRIRWRPILRNIQKSGFEALPITGLLSFLMGFVIAYQGADQLQRFGANIFIVDLVGLSMLRELSPLLTAIIVAGRSGSAYAAQIGTMKVTEEIDALRTIGVGSIELLVLPKMLALIIALPLLTLYADITGILGGMLMAYTKLDIGFDVFFNRIGNAVSLSSFLTGIGKAPVFAAIISLVGCYQGFQVKGSADSVGQQTTVSVVQSIFLVIFADAIFSVVFNWLKL